MPEPELDVLSPEAVQEAERVGAADLVVALPTFHNQETVSDVTTALSVGIARYFPSLRAVLVHVDGGSKDDTVERVRAAAEPSVPLLQITYPIHPVHRMSLPFLGVPGRNEALRTIFTLSLKLGAHTCTIFDADLMSTTPEWVPRLSVPVLENGDDLVLPAYLRHKFEAPINSGILYPVFRALYGKRIRYPAAAEFAVSAKFMEMEMESASISPATDAAVANLRISQAAVGPRSVQARAPELSMILAEVLSIVYESVMRDVAVWQRIRGSERVPVLGTPLGDPLPTPGGINVPRMLESYRLAYQDLQEIWGLVMPPGTLLELKRLARRTDTEFRLADEIWARILYDFALAYRLRIMDRNQLLKATTPLYLAWFASLAIEMEQAGDQEMEARLERMGLAFETEKKYLIARWRWPDRFNP